MKPNIGTIDKVFRLIVATAAILLYLTHQVFGTSAIILLIVAGIFISSVTGFCPLCWPFYISINKKE